jgi:hypothetical protein
MYLSPTYLIQDNPELRNELLTWVLAHKPKIDKADPKVMFQSIISCLQDKGKGVRTMAEEVFAEVYPRVS